MYMVTFTIEGVADYLHNRMTEEDQANIIGGTNTGDRPDDLRDKAAEAKVYVDEVGLFVPPWNIKRVILDGAQRANLKLNKKPLASQLAAVLFVQGAGRFVDGKKRPIVERDYLHKTMGRIPPRTGKPAIVRRPAMKIGWRLLATAAVLDDAVPDESIRRALESAGLKVGIGSWRPEYGRFVVREWEVPPGHSKAKPSEAQPSKARR